MSKKIFSIRTMVAVGIGSAIFFVLMRFVALPSGIPNTNLQLAPAILAIFAAIFGPLAGLLIGFIGHTLVDLTWGSVWWSWVVADAAFGLLIGSFWWVYGLNSGSFNIRRCVLFNLIQIASNVVVWGGIAPSLDVLVYAEPADKVYLQGLLSAGINSAVVLILGSVLAFGYSRSRVKAGSLKAE